MEQKDEGGRMRKKKMERKWKVILTIFLLLNIGATVWIVLHEKEIVQNVVVNDFTSNKINYARMELENLTTSKVTTPSLTTSLDTTDLILSGSIQWPNISLNAFTYNELKDIHVENNLELRKDFPLPTLFPDAKPTFSNNNLQFFDTELNTLYAWNIDPVLTRKYILLFDVECSFTGKMGSSNELHWQWKWGDNVLYTTKKDIPTSMDQGRLQDSFLYFTPSLRSTARTKPGPISIKFTTFPTGVTIHHIRWYIVSM